MTLPDELRDLAKRMRATADRMRRKKLMEWKRHADELDGVAKIAENWADALPPTI